MGKEITQFFSLKKISRGSGYGIGFCVFLYIQSIIASGKRMDHATFNVSRQKCLTCIILVKSSYISKKKKKCTNSTVFILFFLF